MKDIKKNTFKKNSKRTPHKNVLKKINKNPKKILLLVRRKAKPVTITSKFKKAKLIHWPKAKIFKLKKLSRKLKKLNLPSFFFIQNFKNNLEKHFKTFSVDFRWYSSIVLEGKKSASKVITINLNRSESELSKDAYLFVHKRKKIFILVDFAKKKVFVLDIRKVHKLVLNIHSKRTIGSQVRAYTSLKKNLITVHQQATRYLLTETNAKKLQKKFRTRAARLRFAVKNANIQRKLHLPKPVAKLWKIPGHKARRPKKYSKLWFLSEGKKVKRFGSKYNGRDLPRFLMLTHFFLTRNKKIRRILFRRFKKRLILASKMHVEASDRAERIKKLFSTQKQSNKLHKKTKRQNKFKFARKTKNLKVKRSKGYQLLKKTTIYKLRKPKVLIIKLSELGRRRLYISKFTLPYHLKFSQPYSKKRAKRLVKASVVQKQSKLSKKHEQQIKAFLRVNKFAAQKAGNKFKINLIQQTLAHSSNLRMRRLGKGAMTQKTFKIISKQINYKLKWHNYFEFKSFRWKFYRKRWYYSMSRWKRLLAFRRTMRKAWRSYRKLQKNFLFVKLLRANFQYILGIKETELLHNWVKIRRGTNLDKTISPVDRLNQMLQLKMDGLAMFLGLAPNRLMAQELVHFGGLRVNGAIVTDKNYSITQGDMVQIDRKVNSEIQPLYKKTHWTVVKARLKFVQFLQVQWSIMLFMLVRWPKAHELFHGSILNKRWVRFFIRYFPVRISKYKKAKTNWYKF